MNVWVLTKEIGQYEDYDWDVVAVADSAKRAKELANEHERKAQETARPAILRQRAEWPEQRQRILDDHLAALDKMWFGRRDHDCETGLNCKEVRLRQTAEEVYPFPAPVELPWQPEDDGWLASGDQSWRILPRPLNRLVEN